MVGGPAGGLPVSHGVIRRGLARRSPARAPFVIHVFMGANDEYLALIVELNEESEASVDGLSASRERLEDLARRLGAMIRTCGWSSAW